MQSSTFFSSAHFCTHRPFLQKKFHAPERKSKFTTTNAWMWLRRNRRKCRVECLRFCIWDLVFLFIRRNSFSLKYNAIWGVIQPSANNLKMEAALIAGLHLCHAKQWFDFGIYKCYYWYSFMLINDYTKRWHALIGTSVANSAIGTNYKWFTINMHYKEDGFNFR